MSRAFILLVMMIAAAPSVAAQDLIPRLDNGQLRVRAPRLRFLTGEPLDRLMNGASVTYEFQLMLRAEAGSRTFEYVRQRFVVSYDLWEEKFAVTKLGPSPRSVSHLSAAAADVWLLDNVSVQTSALTADRPFWIRLEFRAAEPSDSTQQADDAGLTLGGLVDIFSRRGTDRRLQGSVEEGPFRMADLRKTRSK